jgi:hypothetical protein
VKRISYLANKDGTYSPFVLRFMLHEIRSPRIVGEAGFTGALFYRGAAATFHVWSTDYERWDEEIELGGPDLRCKLFENSIEPFLIGGCYGQKFESDTVGSGPSHRRIADRDRSGLSGRSEL